MVNCISSYSKVLIYIILSLPLAASADVLEEPKLSSEFYAKLSVSVVKILAPAGGKLYAGSGVVVGKEEVLTNCHVVRRSQRITVMKGALRYPVDSQKVDIFKDLCLCLISERGFNKGFANLWFKSIFCNLCISLAVLGPHSSIYFIFSLMRSISS